MNEIERKIADQFCFVEEEIPKSKTPYRVKVGGKFITQGSSSKSVWPSIGAAKSSLNHQYRFAVTTVLLEAQGVPSDSLWGDRWRTTTRKAVWQAFLKEAMDSGFIEFVPVE